MKDSIRYGQGAQPVRVVPIDRRGRPSEVGSVTYTIVDLREAETAARREVVASTTATAPTVSTTLSAAAGPSQANQHRLTLVDATDVRVGGTYLLRSSTTEQAVTVAALQSTTVDTVTPIRSEFGSGSSWLGLEHVGTFPSDVAADETRLETGGGPFQVVWTYTIGSDVYVRGQELWLTRYGVEPWVLPDEVLRHFPGLAASTGVANNLPGAIAGATDEIVAHLIESGSWARDPAYFRGNLGADLAVRKWALAILCRGARTPEMLEQARDFDAQARGHASSLTEGRPNNRAVVVAPVDDVSTSTAAVGGLFARS